MKKFFFANALLASVTGGVLLAAVSVDSYAASLLIGAVEFQNLGRCLSAINELGPEYAEGTKAPPLSGAGVPKDLSIAIGTPVDMLIYSATGDNYKVSGKGCQPVRAKDQPKAGDIVLKRYRDALNNRSGGKRAEALKRDMTENCLSYFKDDPIYDAQFRAASPNPAVKEGGLTLSAPAVSSAP